MKISEERNDYQSIKTWAVDDRPREKMLNHGRSSLSNAELIAILLRSGTNSQSAVDVARQILSDCKDNLNVLARLDQGDLCGYPGIGPVKAVTLMAALELGRRRKNTEQSRVKITSSEEAYEAIRPILSDLNHEEFWVIALNRNNSIMDSYMISRGGVSGTVADIKMIFKPAIQLLASAIIVCHNHPSGNLSPSKADIKLTEKVRMSGEILDIKLLDHLIIADNGYFSFADKQIL